VPGQIGGLAMSARERLPNRRRCETREFEHAGLSFALARNIEAIGLLHPVVVTPSNELICGARRLEAARLLGWKEIPARVVDIQAIVLGEQAENELRKDFTMSERVAIGAAVEAKLGERRGQRTDLPQHTENFPEVKGETRNLAGERAGFGNGRTYEQAKAIVIAATVEPEKFGKLQADMDRTGRVSGPFKRLKIIRQSAEIRKEPPPLPGRGPYRVIVADPPWPYEIRTEDPSHRGVLPYATTSIEQIHALAVKGIAHDDCVLWLWTTNHHMREAFGVLDAWGFTQKTILTWAKDRMGLGDWLRGQTEHCLLAVRGKPIVQLTNETTLLHAPVRKHSQKPLEFYDLVERLCPAPRYGYLFSRYRHNEKWDCHGDEAPTGVEGGAR
jgi:N6-adenosine-specific RNA methylase IME4